jgi:hypothetical protein
MFRAPCSPQAGNFCGPGLSCFDRRCGVCKDGVTPLLSGERRWLLPERCVDGRYVVTRWDIHLAEPRFAAAAVAVLAGLLWVGVQCGWCAQLHACCSRARRSVRLLQAGRVMNVDKLQRMHALLERVDGRRV